MNKKILFIPLVAFLLLAGVFATQLMKNSAGDDPTKLESVLVGKTVPEFRLKIWQSPVSYTISRFSKVSLYCSMCGRPGVQPVMPSINISMSWPNKG